MEVAWKDSIYIGKILEILGSVGVRVSRRGVPSTGLFFLSGRALGRLFFAFFRSWALLGRHRRSKSRLGAIFGDLESIFGGFGRVWGGFWEGFEGFF